MAKKDKNALNQEKESFSEGISKKFKQNPGVYIGSVAILVLVTVTFIGGDFLSGGGLSGGSGDLTFGYYDKKPISWVPGNMFSQYYERAVFNFRNQGYDPNDNWVNYYVWKQAYDGAVVHTGILSMTHNSKYTPSEKAVDRAVLQLPQFQDNGRFSMALYNRMTDTARLSLWRQTQEELAKISFFSDFFGLLIPENESNFIAAMSSPQRSFDFVSFQIDDYPDSEYLAYANNNPELFNSIHLSKISVSTNEREAKRILASIRDGNISFEDAARAQSADNYADRGGDMGIRYMYELESEFNNSQDRDALFKLARDEISEVISTIDGWSFYKIMNELTQADFNDPVVMDKVRYYVRNYPRGLMEEWAIAQADDFIEEAQSAGFINAARWRNKTIRSFGPIPLNFGGVDLFTSLESLTVDGLSAQDLQSLSQNDEFWKTAFRTPVNAPSKPLVQGSNVYVFLPTSETESDESALENIVNQYTAYFLNSTAEQSLHFYFLNNEKMDDRFSDTYFRYFAQ